MLPHPVLPRSEPYIVNFSEFCTNMTFFTLVQHQSLAMKFVSAVYSFEAAQPHILFVMLLSAIHH